MVPLTQWVGQLPTTQLTGVDIYHHPDLLPFLQAIRFDFDRTTSYSDNVVPKVQQIDHYLIIQGYNCNQQECRDGYAIIYNLTSHQAGICQQRLMLNCYPGNSPNGQEIELVKQEQHMIFQQQGDKQIVAINDADLSLGCGGGLEGDASGVLKLFLSAHEGDL